MRNNLCCFPPLLLIYTPLILESERHPTDVQASKMVLGLIVGSSLFYLVWSLAALESNYRRAASMGIPLVRVPIDPLNILFQVFESHVWNVVDRIPFALPLPAWTRYARRGWYFTDKAEPHLRYGPIWALVTPRDIHILVSDLEAVHDIFARRNDFVRPNKMYSEFMYSIRKESS